MNRTAVPLLLLLAACHSAIGGEKAAVSPAWSGLRPDEVLHFTGTEPFWSGDLAGERLTWRTSAQQEGTTITVERFGGRNGLGLSGTLEGQPFELAVSAAQCSDGMSERTYPFAITAQLGTQILRGCGWSDVHPASTGSPR